MKNLAITVTAAVVTAALTSVITSRYTTKDVVSRLDELNAEIVKLQERQKDGNRLPPPSVVVPTPIERKTQKGEAPKISDIFKTQLVQYLKDAGRLSTQSSTGITAGAFSSQFTEIKATFDLVDQTWPHGFSPDARAAFQKSHEGYALVAQLWKLKREREDSSYGLSNENEIAPYVSYLKGLAVFTSYGDGVKWFTFDENISALLAVAAKHFEDGRRSVLAVLE